MSTIPQNIAVPRNITAKSLQQYSAQNYQTTNTTYTESGRNTFPALASFFIPGTGQILNGEGSKGMGLLTASLGLFTGRKICGGIVKNAMHAIDQAKMILHTEEATRSLNKSMQSMEKAMPKGIGDSLKSLNRMFDTMSPKIAQTKITPEKIKALENATGPKIAALLIPVLFLSGMALSIYAAVDAYKYNGK